MPLDRSGRMPGTVRLRVETYTETSGQGTILMLSGAPYPPQTGPLGSLDRDVEGLDTRRAIIFDLRGTQGAARLRCDALRRSRSRQAVADCAEQLGPRRAHYTTADNVADVEAVRQAVGVERMSIYGLDYGAQIALAYAAAHPDRVERLVLDSPLPPEGPDPFARPTFRAIARHAATICSRGCRFTDDTLGELTELLERVGRAPLRARRYDDHGRSRSLAIGPGDVRDAILGGDANIIGSFLWPGAVHSALHGDPAPLARLVHAATIADPLRAPGGALLLARMCSEEAPGAALLAPSSDAFAPFDETLAAAVAPAGICERWPDTPAVNAQPPLPPVPTLVLSGMRDLGTPLEGATALAARIPGAQLLAVPLLGHDLLTWHYADPPYCNTDAIRAFGKGRPIQPCRRARDLAAWPIAPPRRLRDVVPAGRRLPPRIARTVRAVQLTLLDFAWTLFAVSDRPVGLGGLRGGSIDYANKALRLRDYSYVPGVEVTARIFDDDEQRSWLRVGGSAAVHGTLRLRGCEESNCFYGTLGGERVRIRLPGSG